MEVVTDCRRCGGKASGAFLCARCTRELGKTLAELPWWLHRLTEAALGQTRMADNGGRKSARRNGLDGDAPLASCIELLPNEDDLDKARRQREQAALRHALAAGGVNARASELLAEITDSLAYWCRVLCDERGMAYEPWVVRHRPSALGQNHAEWLRAHLHTITQSESVDDIAGDVDSHAEEIVKVVNRPIRFWYLGECQTWDDKRNGACGMHLRAPEQSIEIYCPRCHVTHNVNRLFLARIDEVERDRRTFDQLVKFNRELPVEYQVSPRTLRHWRQTGALKPRSVHDGEPLYSWADVKRLIRGKPQRQRTGRAAQKA